MIPAPKKILFSREESGVQPEQIDLQSEELIVGPQQFNFSADRNPMVRDLHCVLE
jgi:hypothetical protein